jgi:hypothetical protein
MKLLDMSPFRLIFLLICVNPTSALKAAKAILDDVRAVGFCSANLYDVPDKSDLGNMRIANRGLRENRVLRQLQLRQVSTQRRCGLARCGSASTT